MGIAWTEENNNMTVLCPKFGREHCNLNHPVLEELSVGAHYETLHFCPVHETPRTWDYEHSAQRIRDIQESVKEAQWEAFSKNHDGRVCKFQCRYNRTDRTWEAAYDPMQCGFYKCSRCVVLDKEVSPKLANVIYDVKVIWLIKGEGILPDEEKIRITKGVKYLDHPKSETVCNAIAEVCRNDIKSREELRHHMDIFFGKIQSIEILNVRVERKVGRDLMQDLQDAENGIEVVHVSDLVVEAKEEKRRRRTEATERKKKRIEKKILDIGYDGLDDYDKRRAKKTLGATRIVQIEHRRIEESVTQVAMEGF